VCADVCVEYGIKIGNDYKHAGTVFVGCIADVILTHVIQPANATSKIDEKMGKSRNVRHLPRLSHYFSHHCVTTPEVAVSIPPATRKAPMPDTAGLQSPPMRRGCHAPRAVALVARLLCVGDVCL
jgi:hypothetical protein